jgi:hypothetical protein
MTRRLIPLAALLALALLIAPETGRAWVDPPGGQPDYLYITTYDYALGGQNCFWDGEQNICTHTALMIPTDVDLYDWTAACPREWVTYRWTTVVAIYGIEFWCIDNFGAEVNQRAVEIDGNLVWRVDILSYRPARHPWNQKLVPLHFVTTRSGSMLEFWSIRDGLHGKPLEVSLK